VNIDACEARVDGAAAIAFSNSTASWLNASILGLVGRWYP
jgi:hypothetical protein